MVCHLLPHRLARGFIPASIVKMTGERFTALPSKHPFGHYFDAARHGLLLHVHRRRPDDRGAAAAHSTNGAYGSDNPNACRRFCDCIYKQGDSLQARLNGYHRAKQARNPDPVR